MTNGEVINIKQISYDLSSKLIYSLDKNLIALGLKDGSIKIISLINGQEVHTLNLHDEPVLTSQFSPDGKILASGSLDGKIILWDVLSGQAIHMFVIPGPSDITSLSFSPDGQTLVSGIRGLPSSVKLWDIKNMQELKTLDRFVCNWPGVAFSPVNDTLATWCEFQREVIIWDINYGNRVKVLNGFSLERRGLDFSDDDNMIAFGEDDKVRIFDIIDGSDHISLERDERLGRVCKIQYWAGSELIVSYGRTGRITWDLSNGREIEVIEETGNGECINEGNDLITIDYISGTPAEIKENTVHWLDIDGDTHIFTHDTRVQSIVFLRDGKILAAGQEDGLISLWDLETKSKILDLDGHRNKVNNLKVSHDGKLLASASDDGTIRLWGIPP